MTGGIKGPVKPRPILVVGSLNMDLVATAKRLPQSGETVFGQSFATFPGGKGANQAVAAGKLGARVIMAGCVGSDVFGEALLHSLTESGVTSGCVRQVTGATGTALITVAESGDNMIVVVPGANESCAPQDVDAALAVLPEPGILLVQHEVPPATVEYAVRAAKRTGWTVILNPAPARLLPAKLLSLVDIITPNETEAAALTGLPVTNPADAKLAAGRLLEQGVKQVIITMGAQGAFYMTSASEAVIPPIAVTAVDTTAAGDAYTGALAVALAEGQAMPAALRFAAAAAGLAVTRQGAQAALPWRGEVDRYLEDKERTLV